MIKKILIGFCLFLILLTTPVMATTYGSVTDVGTNYITDTGASYIEDDLIGYTLTFTSGDLNGESYDISDNNQYSIWLVFGNECTDASFEESVWIYTRTSPNIAEKSSTEAYSGTYSGYMKRTDSSEGCYIRHQNNQFAGAEYVGFWVYNTKSTAQTLPVYYVSTATYTTVPAGTGWHWVVSEIPSGFRYNGVSAFTIGSAYSDDYTFEVYIDDFYILNQDLESIGVDEGDNYSINYDAPVPVAGFHATPTTGDTPLNVKFWDDSTGGDHWIWYFGDGYYTEYTDTAYGPYPQGGPTHTYYEAGSYTVQQCVQNEYGEAWENKTAYITVTTPPISGETTIRWDKSAYTQGETAIITYYIRDSDWNPGSYYYYGQILDLDGVQDIQEWDIEFQPSGSIISQYIDSSVFSESGSYYCVLYAESKATGSKTLLASDAAAIKLFEHVSVSGTTYDAINMTPLSAVNVSISQAGSTSYTTSSTWGFYGKDDLYDSLWVGINGTKDGWVCSPSGFSPSGTHEYVVDLSLIPAGGAEPGDWANTGNDSYSTNTTYSSTNTSYWSAEVYGSAVGGYVYGGAMVAALPGATVTMSNATWNASTESGSDGWYMFSEMGDGIYPGSYTISAEQTGYETSSTSVVVVEDYFGRKDFYLARGEYTYTDDSSSAENTSYWTTAEGTACGGIVYHGELWDVGGGDSITISNASWSNTTTTGTGGWWKFNESDGLSDDEEYYIEVSHTGYTTVNTTITCVADKFTRKDFHLGEEYSLTVHVKDSNTASYVTSNVTVILGETVSHPTDGTAEFTTLSYGSYALYVSADGYYASTGYVVVDSAGDTETVYLSKETDPGDSGPSSNYPPHLVRFTYVDAWGNPITEATVTATAISSSTPWSWLAGAFGFDTNTVDIRNETMVAYTDSGGGVSFMMLESVQYSIRCVKGSESIDHTIQVYPKESEYFIRIGSLPLATDYPEYDITAYSVNDSYVRLSVNYTDAADATTSAMFYVNDINGTELYNTSISLTGGSGSATYDVENVRGSSVEAKLVAENTAHGTITASRGVDLKGTGKLVDFGWPDLWYILISFAGILIVAGSIGEMDTKVGAMFVPITAGMFWYIGWLPGIATAVITMVFFVGGIYYMRASITKVDS